MAYIDWIERSRESRLQSECHCPSESLRRREGEKDVFLEAAVEGVHGAPEPAPEGLHPPAQREVLLEVGGPVVRVSVL